MPEKKAKKTLADLANRFDKNVSMPRRINEAIAAIAKNGDDFEYEMEFSRLVNPPIQLADLARYREQFNDFWVEVRDVGKHTATRRVWFASKALCKKWKEQVGG